MTKHELLGDIAMNRVRLGLGMAAAMGLALLLAGCGGGGSPAPPPPPETPQNAAPTLTSISPTSAVAGTSALTLTATGSSFLSASTIELNGSALPTTYGSATTLTATLPAAALAAAAADQISVVTPAPGGGSSASLAFTVVGSNPIPGLSSVTPASLLAGAADTTLSLSGSNFIAASVAQLGGQALATKFVSATALTAVAPASLLGKAAAALPLVVVNPSPGGGSSPGLSVAVLNPVPGASAVAPASVLVGSGDTTLTVTGTGFQSGSVASFNGTALATTVASPVSLSAVAPAALLGTAAVAQLTVANPAPGGGSSAALSFTVANPVATISGVSPASATAGAGDTTITVTGTNLLAGSVVDLGSTALATTFVSGTSAKAVVPAALLALGAADTITVVNPAPGGGASAGTAFLVNNPVPALATLSPASVPAQSPAGTLTIAGSGFVASSTVSFHGVAHAATVVSPTQITLALSAADQTSPASDAVSVTNPAPGGGASNSLYFSVQAATTGSGSTAVTVETIAVPSAADSAAGQGTATNFETVDVAYVPQVTDKTVAIVNMDATAPTGTSIITNALVATVAMPTGFTPNFTASDPTDAVVLVGSYTSNQIQIISTATHTLTGSYQIQAGSAVTFSGGSCVVCGMVVDDLPGHGYAIASTAGGFTIFQPMTGVPTQAGLFSVPAAENFGYDSSLGTIFDPYYGTGFFSSYGLSALSLAGNGSISTIAAGVGANPDAAAADPQTHLVVVPDEYSGQETLFNFNPGATGSRPGTASAAQAARGVARLEETSALARMKAAVAAAARPRLGAAAAPAPQGIEAWRYRSAQVPGASALIPAATSAAAPTAPPAAAQPDDPAARAAWFRLGRRAPLGGPSAAALLLAARRQSDGMALRSAAAGSATAGAAASWTEQGPRPQSGGSYGMVGGRVTSLAADLVKDPTGNTLYVGTAFGGVWESTNALGASPTFTPISDPAQSLAVGAIALDASTSPTTIYVGTGEANLAGDSYYGVGILKSADGGHSWTLASSADAGKESFFQMTFSRILVDPASPHTLLAATAWAGVTTQAGFNRGIYRSLDGSTWSLVYSNNHAAITDLAYDAKSGNYYAAVQGTGLVVSRDHGVTWQATASPFAGGGTFSPSDFQRVSLAAANGIVYALISNAAGVPATPSTCCDTGLAQSADQGATWSAIHLPPGLYSTTNNGKGQGWYDQSLGVITGAGANQSLVVGGLDVWMAQLGTPNPSWSNLTRAYTGGSVHSDQHALVILNANTWYIGEDGGVWSTSNAGTSWADLNATLGAIQFTSVSSDPKTGTLFGGSQDNGTALQSPTHGWGWTTVWGGDGGYTASNLNTPAQMFTENFDVSLQRSDDGGGSFHQVLSSLPDSQSAFYVPYELLPADAGTVLLGTCRVWAGPASPSYAGAGWYPVSPDLGLSNGAMVSSTSDGCSSGDYILGLAVAPSSPDTIYAVTAQGAVQVTTNATTLVQWTSRAAAPLPTDGEHPFSSVAVSPTDPKTAYLTVQGFGAGHVFKTTDAGQTWVDITGNLPDSPANSILIDPLEPSDIYVGTDVGVFAAVDGGTAGESWQTMGTGLPDTAVVQLQFTQSGARQLIAATHGRGAWTIPPLDASPDFYLGLTPGRQSATTASGASIQVTVSGVNGEASVALTCTVPSSGCAVTPATVAGSGTATVTVSASALQGGDNAVTISASDGTHVHSATAVVVIAGFALAFAPPTMAVQAGSTATALLNFTAEGGYSGTVGLTCSAPAGLACAALSNTYLNATTPSSYLSIAAAAATPPGTYTVALTGSDGTLSGSAKLRVVVSAAPAAVSGNPPFATFRVGFDGQTCGSTNEWTMVGIEPLSHVLALGQEFAGCIAVAQLPAAASLAAPAAPSLVRFGQLPNDPDGGGWNNGGDPHGLAVFTSVVTGKAVGFVVENNGSLPWIVRFNLGDVLAAPADPLTGEVSPATLAALITFLKTQ